MKLACVWVVYTYFKLGFAVAAKLGQRGSLKDVNSTQDRIELPSENNRTQDQANKWKFAFGKLAPYGPNEVVEKAYEPLPNKTLYAEAEACGFNNVRMSWEIAICYSYLTRRTYRIPDLYQHFGMQVPLAKFAEWGLPSNLFAYYDERSFKKVIPSVLASAPLLPQDTWAPPENMILHNPGDYTQLNLVYSSKRGPTRNLWQYAADKHLVPHNRYVQLIESALRVRSDLLDRAAKLLEEHGLEPGKYVAIHRRRGDFDQGYNKGMRILDDDFVAKYVEPMVKGRTVLIVTDVPDKDFEDKLLRISNATRVVCWAGKERFGADLAFAPQVDMLAAVPASSFIGTPVSTFSYGIIRWRVQAGTHKKGTPLSWVTPDVRVGGDDDWNSPGAAETYLLREKSDESARKREALREVASNETTWFTETELFSS